MKKKLLAAPGNWPGGFGKDYKEKKKNNFSPGEAYLEASRCLYCYDAPCTEACPAQIDVVGFIQRLKSRNYEGACSLIREKNILGEVCGWICPAEELCEKACLKSLLSQPIEIAKLQRFACKAGRHSILHPTIKELSLKVAVVGGGPSGLACAAELRRLGFQVTIFEARNRLGGLLTEQIPQFKLPFRVLQKEIRTIKKTGATISCGIKAGRDISFKDLFSKFQAIFLGVGLPEPIRLKVEGNNLKGIYSSDQVLKVLRVNSSLRLGREAIVVGGGNVAMDVAVSLKKMGVEKVTILYRRGPEEMPAWKSSYQEALDNGVQFLYHTLPLIYLGKERVSSVRCIQTRPRKGVPCPVPNSEFELSADSVIEALGMMPDKNLARKLKLKTDREGLILVDPKTGLTSHPPIFAGGDCVNCGATVVQAVAEGRRAAQGIFQFFQR